MRQVTVPGWEDLRVGWTLLVESMKTRHTHAKNMTDAMITWHLQVSTPSPPWHQTC